MKEYHVQVDIYDLAREQAIDSIDLVYDGEYETSDIDVVFTGIIDNEADFRVVVTGPNAEAIMAALSS